MPLFSPESKDPTEALYAEMESFYELYVPDADELREKIESGEMIERFAQSQRIPINPEDKTTIHDELLQNVLYVELACRNAETFTDFQERVHAIDVSQTAKFVIFQHALASANEERMAAEESIEGNNVEKILRFSGFIASYIERILSSPSD